jgi:hypothetical protein
MAAPEELELSLSFWKRIAPRFGVGVGDVVFTELDGRSSI